MPEELKKQILPLLMGIFPDELKYTDSKSEGEKFTYKSAHFTWYNRFAKGVSYILGISKNSLSYVRFRERMSLPTLSLPLSKKLTKEILTHFCVNRSDHRTSRSTSKNTICLIKTFKLCSSGLLERYYFFFEDFIVTLIAKCLVEGCSSRRVRNNVPGSYGSACQRKTRGLSFHWIHSKLQCHYSYTQR